MKLENVKGTQDIMPEEKIALNSIIDSLRESFELYGYNPLETPAIEYLEVLASKFAGGEEILKEIYKLTDQGKRELALRYDLTVPFARVVAMNPHVKKPFKRYQIDKVWRDGPIKLGRYREFWQCDCDVVGVKSIAAEAELLAMAKGFFEKLGLEISVRVNNRKLLAEMMAFAGVSEEMSNSAILSIDKLLKIKADGVEKELIEKGLSEEVADSVIEIISNNFEGIAKLLPGSKGVSELRELMGYCSENGVEIDVEPTLARGLAYYTGTIYEIFVKDGSFGGAIAAGGRYDTMITEFVSDGKDYPCVGISFGLSALKDALKKKELLDCRKSVVDVLVVSMSEDVAARKVTRELRFAGVNTELDLMGRNISKNLDFANKMGIRYVAIIGEDEAKEDKVTLKDMQEGNQEMILVADVVNKVHE